MASVRAATLLAPHQLEVRSYPYPDALEPGAVLLRMLASGICGTDKHTFRGETEQYLGHRQGALDAVPDHPGARERRRGGRRRRRWSARARRLAAGGRRSCRPGAQPRLRHVPHVRARVPVLPLPPARELRQLALEQRCAAPVRRLVGVPLPQARHGGVPRSRGAARRCRGADGDLRGHAQPRARRPAAEPGGLPAGRVGCRDRRRGARAGARRQGGADGRGARDRGRSLAPPPGARGALGGSRGERGRRGRGRRRGRQRHRVSRAHSRRRWRWCATAAW